MKITKAQIQKMIKEELGALEEASYSPGGFRGYNLPDREELPSADQDRKASDAAYMGREKTRREREQAADDEVGAKLNKKIRQDLARQDQAAADKQTAKFLANVNNMIKQLEKIQYKQMGARKIISNVDNVALQFKDSKQASKNYTLDQIRSIDRALSTANSNYNRGFNRGDKESRKEYDFYENNFNKSLSQARKRVRAAKNIILQRIKAAEDAAAAAERAKYTASKTSEIDDQTRKMAQDLGIEGWKTRDISSLQQQMAMMGQMYEGLTLTAEELDRIIDEEIQNITKGN